MKRRAQRGLGDFFTAVGRAQSIAVLWAITVRHFRDAGFGAVAYVLQDQGRLGQNVAILESGFPPAVVERFAELGYGDDAPALRIAMATGQPVIAGKVYETHKLSRKEIAHREAIIAAGLEEALVLPLYGPMGRGAIGVLSVPSDAALFDRQYWPELHIAAQAAHIQGFALRSHRPVVTNDLSIREIEILRWVAQGKSNSVIAEILEIAPATVDTYLRRLFEKLDVADRTSAAVKGVSMGLIRA